MSVYFVCNLPNIKMNMSMGMKIINFDMQFKNRNYGDEL